MASRGRTSVDRSEIRADFVKRLFAVAVSVGFAATITQMEWVRNGTLPQSNEAEQLAILVTGMVLTVLSWDGYLVSIWDKPLNDYPRFCIDIILVFIYMFFLISSTQPDFWLPILGIVFILYFVWDVLTIREHPKKYNQSRVDDKAAKKQKACIREVIIVYAGGLRDQSTIKRGPIITLSWAVYFVALAALNLTIEEHQVYVMTAFATVGLVTYRIDKTFKTNRPGITGFRMLVRGLSIAFLLSLTALYLCEFRIAVAS